MTETMLEIYGLTLPIVGAESMTMGLTLLLLCVAKKRGYIYNKTGLVFLGLSMLVLGLINFAECIFGTGSTPPHENSRFALVIFAASVELFLLLCAYVSMLDKRFVTFRRICLELVLIGVFTVPALFVSPERHPELFQLLFFGGIGFYVLKLAWNLQIYKKHLRRLTQEIENFHSNASFSLLTWINNTFYMVLAIGVISVVVPLTDMTVLVGYNIFLMFAYLYIYVEVIRNIYVFDECIAALDSSGRELNDEPFVAGPATDSEDFLSVCRRLFGDWLDARTYRLSGITVDEIATQLHTNRAKLSRSLKTELHMNYYEWIARLRIEDAKRQLVEQPEMSIFEIAISVGIEDKSNFGRTFKRFVGVSPAAYREMHRNTTIGLN